LLRLCHAAAWFGLRRLRWSAGLRLRVLDSWLLRHWRWRRLLCPRILLRWLLLLGGRFLLSLASSSEAFGGL
jgi:hypothetical protein